MGVGLRMLLRGLSLGDFSLPLNLSPRLSALTPDLQPDS